MTLADRSVSWTEVFQSVRSSDTPGLYRRTIPKSELGSLPPRFRVTDEFGPVRLHVEDTGRVPDPRRVAVVETRDAYVAGRRRTIAGLVATGSLLWILSGAVLPADVTAPAGPHGPDRPERR